LRLERWSRVLLAVAAVLFVFTGLSYFLLPDYGAENFAWDVSPLAAMTIGGWSIGFGFAALDSVRDWSPTRGNASLIAIWSGSLLGTSVLVVLGGSVRLDHPLAWTFAAALAIGLASGLLGLPALWTRRKESTGASPVETPAWLRRGFGSVGVLLLGVAVAWLVPEMFAQAVFPGPLSGPTTAAFGAFYAAIGLGALVLAFSDDLETAIRYTRHVLYIFVLITFAALSYLHLFDFAARPTQLAFVGGNVLAAVAGVAFLAWSRRYTTGPTWRP
jgi:hypothetical protein